MCVAFWSLTHPDYALILGTNRDEYLERPTEPAHFHSFRSDTGTDEESETNGTVLSGRDLLAGGTWLGLSRTGRLALLTNITEPGAKYASSRGELLSSFLLTHPTSVDLAKEVEDLVRQDTAFAGFNLLLLAPSPASSHPHCSSLLFDSMFVTNSGGGGSLTARPLTNAERACGGMSNGIDGQGANTWPKIVNGTASLNSLLNAISPDMKEEQLTDHLFDLLTSRSADPPRDRSELKNAISIDVLPISSIPSESPRLYGTRLSTVILVRRDGRVLFIERDIWQMGVTGAVSKASPSSQRIFRFGLDTGAQL